jgi:5-hydroxyisourate hydrolase
VTVSTHVLDAVAGSPAAGVPVELARREGAGWTALASATTDADGRIASFATDGSASGARAAGDQGAGARDAGGFAAGVYRLTFEIEGHVTGETFYPQVVIVFRVTDPGGHCHVPLLLSPYAYSTYRGS